VGDESSLEALLEPCGLNAELRTGLARYGAIVLEANRRFNLTGAKSSEELGAHLLDSLTILPWVKEPYLDVGAGAGLPGIPVAIAAGIPVTLLEVTAKKAHFLTETLQRLGLRGEVIARRAEVAGHLPSLRERFASGTARAVGSGPTTAELLLPFIAPGGVAILQRGALPPDERRSLEDAALVLGATLEDERRLDRGRSILILRKLHPTAQRFPRRTGLPQKRPLCGQPGNSKNVPRGTF
jgi:16S rRNA (guanine527-N7)-methyltransferase